MAIQVLVLVISVGALAAGVNYVRVARRMASYVTTRGIVRDRRVAPVPGTSSREGRWGRGGGYRPEVTYSYVVDGVTYTSDRWSTAIDGLKRSEVDKVLAGVPDEVDVHYDPARPQDAILRRSLPRLGYVLIAGGLIGVLLCVATLFS